MKVELANYPWVFWLRISVRTKWFNNYWRTRGANHLEMQIWIFRISIGRPWVKMYLDAHSRDYGSAKYVHKSNKENLKYWFSFKMKPPKTLNP